MSEILRRALASSQHAFAKLQTPYISLDRLENPKAREEMEGPQAGQNTLHYAHEFMMSYLKYIGSKKVTEPVQVPSVL